MRSLAFLVELNSMFHEGNMHALAEHAGQFAPGNTPDVGRLPFRDKDLARNFQGFLADFPSSFRYTLRGLFYHALSATPPIPISFSWAPSQDYQMTIWQPSCGIIVQFRAPIPDVT